MIRFLLSLIPLKFCYTQFTVAPEINGQIARYFVSDRTPVPVIL